MKKGIIVFCLILFALASAVAIKPLQAKGTTTVSVDPTSLNLATAYIGQTIQININVSDVQNLWGWNLQDIRFNPSVLNLTNVQEGPFLKTGGSTFFLWTSQSQIAISQGDIPDVADALAENTSVSGSGVLATLTFQVISSGNSPITLNTTQLLNTHEETPGGTETGVNGQISCTSINGNVEISQISLGTPPPTTPSPIPTPSSSPSDAASNTDPASNMFLYVGIAAVVVIAIVASVIVVSRQSAHKSKHKSIHKLWR